MSTDFRELETLLDQVLQEQASLIKPDTRRIAILSAVERFSKDKPKVVTKDISATGAYDYSLPTDVGKAWADEFSFIISIEYPANQQEPVILDKEDYIVYDNGTSKVLRFLTSSPQAGYTIRLKFTAKWSLTDLTSTIEDRDAYPLSCLAASFCLRMLATHYLQTTAPNLDIDVIDYSRKSIESSVLADAIENIYRDHVGIPRIGARSKTEAPVSAASGEKDLDIEFPWKENYITHPKRWR